jgi:aspartate/methionine/tyrosine aminotransferase
MQGRQRGDDRVRMDLRFALRVARLGALISAIVELFVEQSCSVYFSVANTGMGAMEFCKRVLEEAHIALTPGNDFGQQGATQYVRLSFAASIPELTEGLARLGRFLSRETA